MSVCTWAEGKGPQEGIALKGGHPGSPQRTVLLHRPLGSPCTLHVPRHSFIFLFCPLPLSFLRTRTVCSASNDSGKPSQRRAHPEPVEPSPCQTIRSSQDLGVRAPDASYSEGKAQAASLRVSPLTCWLPELAFAPCSDLENHAFYLSCCFCHLA